MALKGTPSPELEVRLWKDACGPPKPREHKHDFKLVPSTIREGYVAKCRHCGLYYSGEA